MGGGGGGGGRRGLESGGCPCGWRKRTGGGRGDGGADWLFPQSVQLQSPLTCGMPGGKHAAGQAGKDKKCFGYKQKHA